MIEIKVPTVGESISEVTLLKWIKKDGEYVERDEVIAELESEKATFEVNAEKAGVLKPSGKEGDTLKIGDVVAQIDETAAKPAAKQLRKKRKQRLLPMRQPEPETRSSSEIITKHPVAAEAGKPCSCRYKSNSRCRRDHRG